MTRHIVGRTWSGDHSGVSDHRNCDGRRTFLTSPKSQACPFKGARFTAPQADVANFAYENRLCKNTLSTWKSSRSAIQNGLFFALSRTEDRGTGQIAPFGKSRPRFYTASVGSGLSVVPTERPKCGQV